MDSATQIGIDRVDIALPLTLYCYQIGIIFYIQITFYFCGNFSQCMLI